MATAYPLSDQLDTGTEDSQGEENPFQTVMSPKERRAKRKREGSLLIESLARSNSSSESDSENHNTEYLTPMKQESSNKDTHPTDLKILITPIDKQKSLRNTSPLIIAKEIQAICNEPVLSIKQISSGLLVTCKHIKQYRRVQQIQSVGNIPVRVVEKEKGVKGVIYGVPLEMSEAEILHEMKSQQVTAVKRMTKRSNKTPLETEEKPNQERPNNPKITPSTQFSQSMNVILTFNRPVLPPQIQLCFQIFQVKQYIPPPIRCFKCQRFGHTAYQCRFKERCVRCGETHSFDQCTHKDTPKCINCGGTHSAAYGGCEMAKTATEIQKVKIEKKISYAQATKLVSEKTNNNKEDLTSRHPYAQPTSSKPDTGKGSFKGKSSHKNKPAPTTFDPENQNNQVDPPDLPQTPQANKTTCNPKDDTCYSQNLPKENDHSFPQKDKQGNNALSIENSDMIINLIMAIISVFTKDMKKIDEMYNINMIKAAAERLLQVKENEFLNNEDN